MWTTTTQFRRSPLRYGRRAVRSIQVDGAGMQITIDHRSLPCANRHSAPAQYLLFPIALRLFKELQTTLAMSSKDLGDIEIQVQESVASKDIDQTDALIADWDAPENKENPRNWSARE